jgi:DNA polymerase
VQILTIDFETYYDSKFSLSKLTTEEYIRNPLFEVIGVGVKVNDSDPQWFSGTHAEIKKFLQSFDIPNSVIIAHNAMFDAAILSWIFNITPHGIIDTLSMARAIDGIEVGGSLKAAADRYGLGTKGTEVIAAIGKRRADFHPQDLKQYGEYCKNDCNLTYDLFGVYYPRISPIELKIIDITIRMFSEPALVLDVELLTQHLDSVKEIKAALLYACFADKDTLMSNPKFAELLSSLGVVPPTKTSPATGKETWAFAKTDEGMIALLDHEDDRVQAIVAARLGTKSTLEETRTERFIGVAGRGTLPVPLRYYAAKTGRWGGCLVADTEVIVYDPTQGVVTKRIVDVLPDDLVWDGVEFVPHEGVQFSGYQEVIHWDGISGTEDHVVFTYAGEISLRDAMQGAHRIQIARSPNEDDVDTARKFASIHHS